MRKIRQNNKRTAKYLKKLPTIYLIACWAKWGIMSLPFSGKYKEIRGENIPLVWIYNDCNGLCDEYHLVPIIYATSGRIKTWTESPEEAERILMELESES